IASAVIGLGMSYGTTLLQPLHKGNQKRLERAGKVIDHKAEQLVTRASGFEDWYLQCQAWDCQAYRPEGMAQHEGIFAPLLEEVFVPLGLDLSASKPGFKLPPGDPATQALAQIQDLKIWHFMGKAEQNRPFRQLAILAWGGYGKTTLLKHVAYMHAIQQQKRFQVPKRIPVLLVLRKYRDILAKADAPDLPTLITEHHIPNLPKEGDDRPAPENWATDLLRRGQVVVMLDGFDEVAKDQRPAVARWINAQMRRYGNSIFMLTSRPKAYKEQDAADRLELSTTLWVRDFNENQRCDFVTRWYQCQERYAHGGRDTPDVRQIASDSAHDLLSQIEARQELKDLAKNPLLLNMIVTFHRRYPGAKLPRRRVELYREICLLQLRDRPRARKLDTLLTQCDAQTILQMLALEMMEHKWERVPRGQLVALLKGYLQTQGETVEAKDFLEQVVQISELLVEQEDDIEFAHLSFQEYLAAAEIARTHKEETLHFDDDWWKPTILLYAAQVNPTGLIRKMLAMEATDLAYACWQDTTKRIDPGLAAELEGLQQAVETSRYQALEEYLKKGQWQAADEETYRLMITAVGKDVGQFFEPEELLNFPCDQLKAIDGLWVKYSNGKFGFSVQKELYLNQCGGLADGKYRAKVFSSFFDLVGWGVSIDFDISSPRGHLPGWGRDYVWVVSSLASRLVNCSR
ncbi:MAG: GUN4 domain-containing protein, partial [Cyanobacteria bacterium]|nr:GUN4 domain-containing protein [Cyanobacteriota bacterium]